MRLIDADELLARVDEERKYLIARGQTGAEHILVHNFRDLIDNAPTVEPFERIGAICNENCGFYRPQGEWIKKVDNVGFISHICSECGAEIEVEDTCDDHFCFNCGAEMKPKTCTNCETFGQGCGDCEVGDDD